MATSALPLLAGPASAATRPQRTTDQLVTAITVNPDALGSMTPSEVKRLREFGEFDHYDTRVVVGGQTLKADQSANKALATMAASAYCGYHHRAITYARNAVGYKLWGYWVEGTWCTTYSVPSSARIDTTGGDTYYLWWTYEGTIAKGARVTQGAYSNSVDGPIARIWGEGKFKYADYKGALQTRYPCLRINGFGGGKHRDDYRCSYYD